MSENEENFAYTDDYDDDCQNPIIVYLCKGGLNSLKLAVWRCEAAALILAEHWAMNIMTNMDNDNNLPEQEIRQKERKRVTEIIQTARLNGEAQFTSTNIKNFYATLAPGFMPAKDCFNSHRRKKKNVVSVQDL